MYAVFYLKWSTKVNGPTSVGSGSKVAMKLAHGDGLLNVARLIAIVWCVVCLIFTVYRRASAVISYQRPATLVTDWPTGQQCAALCIAV
jgi:hypothetical protein